MIKYIVGWLTFTLAALAQDTSVALDAMAQDYASDKLFSGSVLIAQDGRVLLSKGYGMADEAHAVVNRPATRFRIGSVTKMFTGAGIFLLQERGLLKIDDPIGKYFPDAPAAWAGMTIRHLLTHMSGIPNYTDFPDYPSFKGGPATPSQLVKRFRDKPLNFKPGEKFSYSNSAYVLLGCLIEKLSGQSYGEFLRTNVFEPLGMKDSGYAPGRGFVDQAAKGYQVGPSGLVVDESVDLSVAFSAGGLYSTTEDLLLWTNGFLGGKLLHPESLQQITTDNGNLNGLGIVVAKLNGHQVFAGAGTIEGFNSSLIYMPDGKVTSVVLSNMAVLAADSLNRKLALIAVGDDAELPSAQKGRKVDPATLARYIGNYVIGPGAKLDVSIEEGELVIVLNGQTKFRLIAGKTDDVFQLKAIDGWLKFVSNDKGEIVRLAFTQRGAKLIAVRM